VANVNLVPLPSWALKLSPRLWPQTPPLFDGDPTEDDRELARELFAALDPDSQAWYRSHHADFFRGL